jgi:hypothetical protein
MKSLSLFLLLALGLLLCPAEPSCAADAGDRVANEPDEVLLRDGNLLVGHILEERDDVIVFQTDSLGRIEIPRADIAKIGRGAERTSAISDPDFNSIMFCPTPQTFARGDAYFRDFELFFLNFGYSFSENFDLSIGTLFPISAEIVMLSVGGKLRILDRSEEPLGIALIGSATKIEDVEFGSFGVVIGSGDPQSSANLAVFRAFDDDGDGNTVFLLGVDRQVSRRSKVFAEYGNSSELFDDDDDDFHGFLNVGFKIFGESHSFSISGFRPLVDDSGSFVAFPMIAFSNHW